MRILFITSGNSKKFKIMPFIKVQGQSLAKEGIDVKYFTINGKGIEGYLSSGLRLKKYLKKNKFDIIHAHYTLSGWSALIGITGTCNTPLVLSLMGSDTYGEFIDKNKIKFSSRLNTILTYLIQPFVDRIISKSKNINKFVYLKNKSHIILNEIILNKFYPANNSFRSELKLDNNKKYILFLGDKTNIRKNYYLAARSVQYINDPDVKLIAPYPITHIEVYKYINSVDVLLLTSFAEGSPNTIKEAMACNCPIVSTKVGDVNYLLNGLDGCYIADFDIRDLAHKIKKAINFSINYSGTKGRQRLIKLGLDSESVAKKLITIYNQILSYDIK